jgi:signal peptidase I
MANEKPVGDSPFGNDPFLGNRDFSTYGLPGDTYQMSDDERDYLRAFRNPKYVPGDEEEGYAGPLPDFGAPTFVTSEVPTSSTNYSRPRTVAAGYNPNTDTMTVVFRDGTFYNYYNVSAEEWNAFHASFSKGKPWLNRKSKKQAADGLFIHKPRGKADVTDIDPRIVAELYRVAKISQQTEKPTAGRTYQTGYKNVRGGGYYDIKNSPRGRKRQEVQIRNRKLSDIKSGVNPNKNAGKNRKP